MNRLKIDPLCRRLGGAFFRCSAGCCAGAQHAANCGLSAGNYRGLRGSFYR